jgi:hypothetical protein
MLQQMQSVPCPKEGLGEEEMDARAPSAGSSTNDQMARNGPRGSISRFLSLCIQKSVVRRALIVALVVGPILTLINQYDAIIGRTFGPRFFLKLGLTFLVPYSVSNYSSVMAPLSQAAKKGKPTVVTVYPIAGRQLFFQIPESFCKECDLTIRAVRRAVEELENPTEVQVQIRPWLNYLPQALLRRGWHPPVVTINGKRFSQGVVPDVSDLRETIKGHLSRKEGVP